MPLLVQLQYKIKGDVEFFSQREVGSPSEMVDWRKDVYERHSDLSGGYWQEVYEGHPEFCLGPAEPCST